MFSPLAKVPGPVLNRLTYWPLTLQNMQGKRVMYLHLLQQQYGQSSNETRSHQTAYNS